MSATARCACGWSKTYPSQAAADFNVRRHVCVGAKERRKARRADRHYRCARCGLEKTYPNAPAAQARFWFDKHSCRKQEDKMLRTTQHQAKRALIDRTPKPCLHKVANHQHGTRAAYVLDRCRCLPCAEANTRAQNERERQKAYGRYNKYVPGGPVREHIQALQNAGMGLKTIAKRTGVSTGTLSKIKYGVYAPGPGGRNGNGVLLREPSRRVLRETAEKLYALDPDWSGPLPLADGARLSPEATAKVQRRLQSLVALGWSQSLIGQRLGINSRGNVGPVIHGRESMLFATAKRANALFDELCMTPPPELEHRQKISVSRARRYAKQLGWVPPLALDEDDWTVSPDEGGDEVYLDEAAIYRRMHGDKGVRLTKAEKAELRRRWIASGRSLAELERVTGINAFRPYETEEPQAS